VKKAKAKERDKDCSTQEHSKQKSKAPMATLTTRQVNLKKIEFVEFHFFAICLNVEEIKKGVKHFVLISNVFNFKFKLKIID